MKSPLTTKISFFFFLFVFSAAQGPAQEALEVPLELPEVPIVLISEPVSGRVLFSKNIDRSIPPASLTKLMTLHLAFRALESGKLTKDTAITITPEWDARTAPPGSSLMFLEAGQVVTVQELMQGLAVASGNDAGKVLSSLLAGSESAFVKQMNQEAQSLGLTSTEFFDSFGYSALNRTTARDLSVFIRYYLSRYPETLQWLHNTKEMTYPLSGNLVPGRRFRFGPILQKNRNELLWRYPGTDGLKTGYIPESGYNLAATAQRDGMRLVVILLGLQAPTTAQGIKKRTSAAISALDWGFDNFQPRILPIPPLPEIAAWFSEPSVLALKPLQVPILPLTSSEFSRLTWEYEYQKEVLGPPGAQDELGRIFYKLDGQTLDSVALVRGSPAQEAPWYVGFFHALIRFFLDLGILIFGGEKPLDLRGSAVARTPGFVYNGFTIS